MFPLKFIELNVYFKENILSNNSIYEDVVGFKKSILNCLVSVVIFEAAISLSVWIIYSVLL